MSNETGRQGHAEEADRDRALRPYLDKLRAWDAAEGRAPLDRPARIRVGDRTLTLEVWERERIREALAAQAGVVESCSELLVQGVALLTKSLVDVDRMSREQRPLSSDGLQAAQAELMLDTAIGTALLTETQDLLDALVSAGQVEQAKRLSEFRHKLGHAVTEIQGLLADTEAPVAAEAPVRREAPVRSEEPAAEEQLPEPALDPRSTEEILAALNDQLPSPTPGRTTLLFFGLLVVLLAWSLFVYVPSRFDAQPTIVTETVTSRPELFRDFDARPPSLFVTLAPGAWEGLAEFERRDLVDELARAGSSSGYVGILVRAGDERPVARWLEARGAEMIRHGEEPATP